LAKNLKINIKNTQIAEAINLGSLKSKLAKKKSDAKEESEKVASEKVVNADVPESKEFKEEAPRIKARSKSAFVEPSHQEQERIHAESEEAATPAIQEIVPEKFTKAPPEVVKRNALMDYPSDEVVEKVIEVHLEPVVEIKKEVVEAPSAPAPAPTPTLAPAPIEPPVQKKEMETPPAFPKKSTTHQQLTMVDLPPREKLGPTGRHMRDLIPKKPTVVPVPPRRDQPKDGAREDFKPQNRAKVAPDGPPKAPNPEDESFDPKKGKGGLKPKEFRDIKPVRKVEDQRSFDARDRQGLRASETDDDQGYRRRRRGKPMKYQPEDITIRPTELKIRVPIAIKDLASEMKLKASQLVAKLFLQGIMLTLNDLLDDETTIQLLGLSDLLIATTIVTLAALAC